MKKMLPISTVLLLLFCGFPKLVLSQTVFELRNADRIICPNEVQNFVILSGTSSFDTLCYEVRVNGNRIAGTVSRDTFKFAFAFPDNGQNGKIEVLKIGSTCQNPSRAWDIRIRSVAGRKPTISGDTVIYYGEPRSLPIQTRIDFADGAAAQSFEWFKPERWLVGENNVSLYRDTITRRGCMRFLARNNYCPMAQKSDTSDCHFIRQKVAPPIIPSTPPKIYCSNRSFDYTFIIVEHSANTHLKLLNVKVKYQWKIPNAWQIVGALDADSSVIVVRINGLVNDSVTIRTIALGDTSEKTTHFYDWFRDQLRIEGNLEAPLCRREARRLVLHTGYTHGNNAQITWYADPPDATVPNSGTDIFADFERNFDFQGNKAKIIYKVQTACSVDSIVSPTFWVQSKFFLPFNAKSVQNISLFPNPATGNEVQIHLNDRALTEPRDPCFSLNTFGNNNPLIHIFDLHGNKISEKRLIGKPYGTLDISELNSGCYIVTATVDGQRFVQKLMVVK